MERSEPSLVPEWLKGAGGGGGAAHHSQPPIHQDESGNSFLSRQRSQPSAAVNHGDYDSPRYNSAGSDRSFYPTSRRAASNNSTGASERLFDRGDSYPRAYNSFGRSSGYRGGYEGTLDREREGPRDRERDWDWERDRERDFRDRERALGFGGGDDRDRDRDRSDAPNNFRRSTSGAGLRYESEVPLRRSQSIGGTGRVLENGDKKATADVGSALPTAPPTNIGSLTSSMQKAAFERNFPSLGAQEKQTGVVQSSLGNVSVLSPRPSWQSSSPRPEGVRSATSGGGLTSAGSASVSVGASVNVGGNASGGDGWTSALADVPSSLTGLPSTINGVVSGPVSVPTATSGASALPSVAAPSLIVPKMAEALAFPPRVRTPPQSALESQRSDELAAKQSRQLILMKPTLPKNMGSRDITKPKVIRAVDVVAPQPIKLSQPLASQLVSSPYRPPAPPRPEPLKAPQGKLLVRKTSKEAVGAMVSPSTILKGDGAGSTSVVSAAGALVGMGGTNAGTNASGALAPPRKQKQLLDRRAVPIPPISVPVGEGGTGPRSKESGSASDDKRPPVPAQNRSDFFNALRKKAAGISGSSVEKMEIGALQKNDGINEKGPEAEEEISSFSGDLSQMTPYQVKENGTAGSTFKSSLSNTDVYGISDTKEDVPSNGASNEGAEGNSEQSSTTPSSPVAATNRATATEEEEAAFLRSLGWEESAEESGEGLTEEEINSFYQERLRSMSISPSLPNARNHRLRDVRVDLHVGSIGSISSGMSSSDSESDDDLRVHRRS